MKFRKSMTVAGAAIAAFAVGAGADVVVVGDKGPSSSATPYVVPVAAGVRTISIKIRGSDVETGLADEGLTDRNASNEPVVITTSLTFDGRTHAQIVHLIYNAQQGKKGSAQ